MGIFDFLFGNNKRINKDIAKKMARSERNDEEKRRRDFESEEKKVLCEDGVERLWQYNVWEIIEGKSTSKVVKKITPDKKLFDDSLNLPFDLTIELTNWFKGNGKLMSLGEIMKHNENEYNNSNFHSTGPVPKFRKLLIINGFAINTRWYPKGDYFFLFSGYVDKSRYEKGVLKKPVIKPSSPKLPNWFYGEVRKRGATITNVYTSKKFKLNAVELSMHDFIKGCEIMIQIGGGVEDEKTGKLRDDLGKAIDWFRKNNYEAFKVLFDEI